MISALWDTNYAAQEAVIGMLIIMQPKSKSIVSVSALFVLLFQ